MAVASADAGQWSDERSAAGGRNPWLIASIVSLATFMEVLDISIANVALDHIAGSVSASYDEATWILTSYLIANAIAVPISGWLSNVVGRKRFYMMSVAVFTVSSFFCGIAPSLAFLVLARIAQGIGGGGLAPSEQSILTDTFPPEKRGQAFALYGLTVIVAPIIGPTIGGAITDNISWHWIFFLNLPVGLLSLFLVHTFVVDPPKLEEERKARLASGLRVDVLGIILLILWLGCLEFALDRGQRDDWLESHRIVACIVISTVSMILLWFWEWSRKDPVFDVRLMARPGYLMSIIAMLTMGVIILGTTQLIPQFLQQVMGYTASEAGKAMTFGGLITLIVLPMVGRLTSFVQPKYLVIGGLVVEAVALWRMSGLNGEISLAWASMARFWIAIGLPFLFIPINAVAYVDVPAEKTAEAAAQLNLARNLGGSIGISVAQTVLARRDQFHQSRLVETLTPSTPAFQAWLHGTTRALGFAGADAGRAARGEIYQVVAREAQVLAYMDVFWILSLVVCAIIPLMFLLKKTRLGAGAAAA